VRRAVALPSPIGRITVPDPTSFLWFPLVGAAIGELVGVVRDRTSFGMPDAVRVAMPGTDGLDRLDPALHTAWPVVATGRGATTRGRGDVVSGETR
jgi:hypothetical protein